MCLWAVPPCPRTSPRENLQATLDEKEVGLFRAYYSNLTYKVGEGWGEDGWGGKRIDLFRAYYSNLAYKVGGVGGLGGLWVGGWVGWAAAAAGGPCALPMPMAKPACKPLGGSTIHPIHPYALSIAQAHPLFQGRLYPTPNPDCNPTLVWLR